MRKSQFRRLKSDKIIQTLRHLHERIDDRFHQRKRGLTTICEELLDVAEEARGNVERLRRANVWLRLVPVLVTAIIAYLTYLMFAGIDRQLALPAGIDTSDPRLYSDLKKLLDVLRQIKADIAIPIALAVPVPLIITMFAFIFRLETLWKRRQTLRYLHELRSIIHVVDMHQLTKDPRYVPKQNEPDFVGGEDLVYYLDYCAELLSIAGKVAALYAESSHDPVVIEAVSDLGSITADLSNKIWQKVNIVERQLLAPVSSTVPAAA